MRVLSSEQIREWDACSIEQEGITSFQLMQRAAFTCFRWLKRHLEKSGKISVCCGPGNNGGDGLLIAAYLHQAGYRVQVFAAPDKQGGDRSEALAYCRSAGLAVNTLSALDTDVAYLIDALFGHGMTRPLSGEYLSLVQKINVSNARRIAIDIPSGMPSEPQEVVFTNFVRADEVLTFQQAKQSFFLDEYGAFIGKWTVLDIGLSRSFHPETGPFLLDDPFIGSLIRTKPRFSHKGSFGSTLLVGGSDQYPGAISLATRACLLTGVGKTFVACGPQARVGCLLLAPEAIYIEGDLPHKLFQHLEHQNFTCIAAGPGLGQDPAMTDFLLSPLLKKKSNWVIDADALNLIAAGRVEFPDGGKVITPHPGEFDRLTRVHHSTAERWKTAREWSRNNASVVVLKGAYTSVFMPDGRQFINSTGNEGMAKGGSGDVLCGWIAGYIGRGYPVDEAALIAVYLHGLAADLAVKEIAKDALKAGDIIRYGERVAKKWEN
ncbi:MAG: NAD(P)H-hydrate dehydratase [Bacteroidia bacterium]